MTFFCWRQTIIKYGFIIISTISNSRFLQRNDNKDQEEHWYNVQEKVFHFQSRLQNFKEFATINSMSQQKQPSGYLVRFSSRDNRNRAITVTSYDGEGEHMKSEPFTIPIIRSQQTLDIKHVGVNEIIFSYNDQHPKYPMDQMVLYQWHGRITKGLLFSNKGKFTFKLQNTKICCFQNKTSLMSYFFFFNLYFLFILRYN